MNAIQDTSPSDPRPGDETEATQGKRRRRNAVLGGLAAVAVLAIGIPLATNLFAGEQTAPASPTEAPPAEEPPADPGPQEPTVDPGPKEPSTDPGPKEPSTDPGPMVHITGGVPCTDADGNLLEPGPGPLTTGVTQVWLCGDSTLYDGVPSGLRGPMEPLTLNPDALVETYLGTPESDPDQACTQEYRLAYTLVFEYADEEARVVRGELHGCRTATDGDTVRNGGEELYDAAITAWQEQRRAAEPEGDGRGTDTSHCDVAGTLLPADLDDLALALVCDPEQVTVYPIEDMVEIVEAVRSGGEAIPDDYAWPTEPTTRRITLLDRRQDAIVLTELREGEFWFDADGEMRLYRASPETVEDLTADA